MAKYFADTLGEDRIERRRQGGIHDRGDIGGIKTIRGGRVVVECKNYSSDRIQISKWLAEAETERGNDDAFIGVVAVKVRGTAVPAEQLICMTAETFARLLLGGPEDVRDTAGHDPSTCGPDCIEHGISAENARRSDYLRKARA